MVPGICSTLYSLHFAMTLKSEDLPTLQAQYIQLLDARTIERAHLGMPTIPTFKLLEGRPSKAFFSTTAFFGGILYLDL